MRLFCTTGRAVWEAKKVVLEEWGDKWGDKWGDIIGVTNGVTKQLKKMGRVLAYCGGLWTFKAVFRLSLAIFTRSFLAGFLA